ncbi:MAG: ABC transporter permease [Vicinamibacteria bacterium]|nr:ABC transporter permease [Vicinamibacteria bacterium]
MIKSYLKLALKVLLRRKFFTFISLFGIAFTLVVLTLVTALLDHVVAAYPPETKHGRTVGIYYAQLSGEHSRRNGFAGYALLDKYARNLPNVEQMAVATLQSGAYSYLNGQRVKSYLKRTDGTFWQILDFHFLEGGPFTNADVADHRMVAVINDTTRVRFFGGQPALGKIIEVDGQRFTVVGVVPDVPILRLVPFADIWVPHTTAKSDSYTREYVGDFMGIFLLNDPSKLALTRDELWSRLRTMKPSDPMFNKLEATPETLFDTMGRMFTGNGTGAGTGFGGRLQIALTVAACLFMLLPAVNLINLNTSRIMERASEIGVRKAFGASSRTLVGQFVVENLVLTLVGAAIGFAGAALLLQVINSSGTIQYAQLQLNYRIFGWGVLLAVVFGLLSGVYPAWRMSRLHPVMALKGASR